MVKVLLVTLVLIGTCFYSISALPSPGQGSEEYADSGEHLVKRVNFGTGLGHIQRQKNKYTTDQNNAFNKNFGDDKSQSSKRNFKFGTALGHNSKNSDKYIQSQNAMYEKLFGKRDSLAQDKDLPSNDSPISSDDLKRGGVAFGTALGYNTNKDKYIEDLNKAYNAIYGR